jgi:hypothetical protein
VQLGYLGALVFLAGFLKLPPRLALPVLDFWLLTNLAFVLGPRPTRRFGPIRFPAAVRLVGLGAGALVVLLYGAKTLHRQQVLGQEQRLHESALTAIAEAGRGRICILAGTNDLFKSLSPFRSYAPGTGPVLSITGWQSHDASQGPLRRALGGSPDQTACLLRLAAGPTQQRAAPLWVLTPETAAWLQQRFRFAGSGTVLVPVSAQSLPNDSTLRFYRPQPGTER